MEKIKLNFRDVEYNTFIRGLRSAKVNANDLLTEVSKICNIDFNEDTLNDLYAGRGERTAGKIEDQVKKELAQAKTSSSTVIAAAVNGDLEKFYSLYKIRKEVKPEYIEYLSIDCAGQVSIKEYCFNDIKEDFTSYITTERGKAIREKQEAMVDAINDFLATATVFDSSNIYDIIPSKYPEKGVQLVELAYDKL